MENGKFILRGFSLHLNIDEIEVSIDHLSELENKISSEVGKKFCEEVKSKMGEANKYLRLFYANQRDEIKVGDKVQILPSENCVTNADTLNYDERIELLEGVVKNIFVSESKVSVKLTVNNQTIIVHNHWLEKITKHYTD